MITREQVADLQPGDVVELRDERWPDVVTRGPLEQDIGEWLSLGGVVVASRREGIAGLNRRHTLTVVSRAPRPLYVNSDRTKPVPGDVVRGDGMDSAETWAYFAPDGAWAVVRTCAFADRRTMPARLRLLVDGESGRCVP